MVHLVAHEVSEVDPGDGVLGLLEALGEQSAGERFADRRQLEDAAIELLEGERGRIEGGAGYLDGD